MVKLDEIGDMIYTLHCIKALSNQFSDARITVLCKAMNNSLVENTNAAYTIINDFDHVEKSYDLQVDFRGNWRSLLFALRGGCNYYLDRGSIRFRNKFSGGQGHEIETNQAIIQHLFPKDYEWPSLKLMPSKQDQTYVSGLLHEQNLNQFVLMHCGARDESRRWPVDRFATLVDQINEKHQLQTVFIGSPNENNLVEEVLDKTTNAFNFVGKTNLLQLAALCEKCSFFVGNESGPLHFAVVQKTPLVALFGPGVKNVFYPIYEKQEVIHHVKQNDHTSQTVENSSIFDISLEEVMDKIDQIGVKSPG